MKLDFMASFGPLLLQGMRTTVLVWIATSIMSLILGTLIGIIRARRMRIPFVSKAFDIITFVLRGVPFYVQLLIVYFVLPDLLAINLSPICAGILSLGMCSAAYTSQMVRGGINALADEQWEAAWVLALPKVATLSRVILPQAFRTILPMLCSEFDMLLKSTSIISAIGVLELTRVGMNIIAHEMQVVTVYVVIALMYLAISSILNLLFNRCERKYAYDFR
jgi:His/Glu/Gln/Arg/opine family amino acid ABC transporter permease subunit